MPHCIGNAVDLLACAAEIRARNITAHRADQIAILLGSHVEKEYRRRCFRFLTGDAVAFSQGWQDWYAFHNLFSDRLQWGSGTYLDVGANHPTSTSNTLFFDKCLGWRGVCFEPNTQYHRLIREKRSCTLVPACVLGSASLVVYEGSGQGTRVRVLHNASAVHRDASDARRRLPSLNGNDSSVAEHQCVVAGETLAELGIVKVDFMSIDIEGSEASVLRCWPFHRIAPHAVLMETAAYGRNSMVDLRELDRFFHRHGYANVETFATARSQTAPIWTDNLFVRRASPAVYPPIVYRPDQMHSRQMHCDRDFAPHRSWWCMPWIQWEPSAKIWGECTHPDYL